MDKTGDFFGDLLDEDVELVEEEEDETSIAALQAQVDDAPVVKFINVCLPTPS